MRDVWLGHVICFSYDIRMVITLCMWPNMRTYISSLTLCWAPLGPCPPTRYALVWCALHEMAYACFSIMHCHVGMTSDVRPCASWHMHVSRNTMHCHVGGRRPQAHCWVLRDTLQQAASALVHMFTCVIRGVFRGYLPPYPYTCMAGLSMVLSSQWTLSTWWQCMPQGVWQGCAPAWQGCPWFFSMDTLHLVTVYVTGGVAGLCTCVAGLSMVYLNGHPAWGFLKPTAGCWGTPDSEQDLRLCHVSLHDTCWHMFAHPMTPIPITAPSRHIFWGHSPNKI